MSINVFFSRKFINDGLSRWARKFMTKICCSIFLLHFLFIVQPHTQKKYKKNKKCYNHDCLASPFLPHLILSVKCGTMKIVAIQGALYDLEEEEEEKENLKKLINHFMKL